MSPGDSGNVLNLGLATVIESLKAGCGGIHLILECGWFSIYQRQGLNGMMTEALQDPATFCLDLIVSTQDLE